MPPVAPSGGQVSSDHQGASFVRRP